jgi:hypothetical protein
MKCNTRGDLCAVCCTSDVFLTDRPRLCPTTEQPSCIQSKGIHIQFVNDGPRGMRHRSPRSGAAPRQRSSSFNRLAASGSQASHQRELHS